jgi:hypothetical protein
LVEGRPANGFGCASGVVYVAVGIVAVGFAVGVAYAVGTGDVAVRAGYTDFGVDAPEAIVGYALRAAVFSVWNTKYLRRKLPSF